MHNFFVCGDDVDDRGDSMTSMVTCHRVMKLVVNDMIEVQYRKL